MSAKIIALLVGGGVLAYVAIGFAKRASRGCPLLAQGGPCGPATAPEILLWPLAGVTAK